MSSRFWPLPALRSSCIGGLPACRVPARRPGNFHLRPQMKVTKAKGLNTHLVSTPWTPSRTGDLDASRCVNPAARSPGPCYAWAGHAQAHRHPMRPAQMGIEVVCFGDFHLDQQMKVTRPPGRDPAGNADHSESPKQDKPNGGNGPKTAACIDRQFISERALGRRNHAGAASTVRRISSKHSHQPIIRTRVLSYRSGALQSARCCRSPWARFIEVLLNALRAGSRPGGRVTFICGPK